MAITGEAIGIAPDTGQPLRITIINPREDAPVYHSASFLNAWGHQPVTMVACAAIATVAALVPRAWIVDLIDETVTPIDWSQVGSVVAITGTTIQRVRMREIATEARKLGRLTIVGGSYASLNPDEVGPWCDILCVGEMEEVAGSVFADIEAGKWRARYDGNRPDLGRSPVPRWDLYPNDKAMVGVIQTSRGCPFECDFCDVIAYLGRKQRHKSNEQVLAELDQLHSLGYRAVFLADDNLTVYRRRATSLLEALQGWNLAHSDAPVAFCTQVSVDAARDADLLRLLADAGVSEVFVGIETPNEESLALSKKRQNVGVDLVSVLERFVRHRVAPTCGIIVGFDTDGPDIFDRQAKFIDQLPVPFLSIGPLSAPPKTPLYERLEREGRVTAESTPTPLAPVSTNVIPLRMTQSELLQGVRVLITRVYEIEAFMRRLRRFVEVWGGDTAPAPLSSRQADVFSPFAREMLLRIAGLGPGERRAMQEIIDIVEVRPWLLNQIGGFLMKYAQLRWMFKEWFTDEAAAMHDPLISAA